jgi:nucleotide-binding universal stress UspA family protein
MLPIRKILLPIDFHEGSLRIVPLAAGLAQRFGSEVILAHVITKHDYSPHETKGGRPLQSEELLGEIVEYAQKDLHEAIGSEFEGHRVKCLVRQGGAASEIVEIASEESVDLIVMPTHGYNGFYRFLIGSVTAKVIHDSECPVLTSAHLQNAPAPNLPIKHVLCGVTYSDHSVETLRRAVEVAGEFKAKLTLALVTPSVELYGPGGNYVDRPWRDELVLGATEQLAKLQQQVGSKADTRIESGDPGAGLSRIASQIGADLLVVGCHASGGRLGSNGYGIISNSQIPVLSV